MNSRKTENVIPFKRPSLKEKARGKTLCGRGFHKWAIDQKKQFDVKQGKLVTVYKCSRCGATKTLAH
jgi:hypothetical protein